MADAVDRCAHCGYPLQTGACRRCRGEIRDSAAPHTAVRPGRGATISDFLDGFLTVFRAAGWLLHRPEYKGRLRVPIFANLLVVGLFGGGLFWLVFSQAHSRLGNLDDVPAWADPCLTLGIGVLAGLITALTLYFTAPLLVELVLSPFLDPLAEATERAWARAEMPALDPSILGGIATGLKAALQILLIQILVWVPMLVLSFTGVGAILSFLVAAWLNALIWFEIPCTRRGYGLRTRLRLLRANRARALGLGAGFQVGLLLPVFNFLLLTPAVTVAASVLYFRFEKTGIRERSLAGRVRSTA